MGALRLRTPSARRCSAPCRSAGSGELDLDALARERVVEGQAGGVQELALQAEQAGRAVLGVAAHRVADRLQVDADLVGAPRVQAQAQQRDVGQSDARA